MRVSVVATQHDEANSRTCIRRLLAVLSFATALSCGDNGEASLEFPNVVAASKYIDYTNVGDNSVICMDDALRREDRFIEKTAEYLGVEVPLERILFVRDPEVEFGASKMLACDDASYCYYYDQSRPGGVILSASFRQYHELVHAVDIPALGVGHRLLVEGLAEYLGTTSAADTVLPGFPEAFKAMVNRAPQPDDYRLAMQFVGSLLVRDGVAKYRLLRDELATDGDLEALRQAYSVVYGRSLDDDLVTMSAVPIRSVFSPPGCAAGEAEELEWTEPGLLETRVRGECGDPLFVAPGLGGPSPGFSKTFAIQVDQAGFYESEITGVTGTDGYHFSISACPAADGSVQDAGVILYPGRHLIGVGFLPGPEPRGEATLRIEYQFAVAE